MLTLKINGERRELDVAEDTPLLWVLRDELNLVGTKYGCGIGQCGACTVHLDGKAVRSCSLPVAAAANKSVTTIEGLSENGDHPVQQAWRAHDVPQCGYCQSGQIMTASAFLEENPKASEAELMTAMQGNLCRCGTYNKIKAALVDAAGRM
jgi:aerobic-type carbon monoxide dehydrogenase small subunit (CoxS/CutS family)